MAVFKIRDLMVALRPGLPTPERPKPLDCPDISCVDPSGICDGGFGDSIGCDASLNCDLTCGCTGGCSGCTDACTDTCGPCTFEATNACGACTNLTCGPTCACSNFCSNITCGCSAGCTVACTRTCGFGTCAGCSIAVTCEACGTASICQGGSGCAGSCGACSAAHTCLFSCARSCPADGATLAPPAQIVAQMAPAQLRRLKAQLRTAMQQVSQREKVLAAAAEKGAVVPQTVEQVDALEKKLSEALYELRARRAELQKAAATKAQESNKKAGRRDKN